MKALASKWPCLASLSSTSTPVWSARARLYSSHASPLVQLSDEVKDAIAAKRPVVALETTIYTHGFPFPENVALAMHLEKVTRDNGAVPATIGVLDGVARVGLDRSELERLVRAPKCRKISRRDFSFALGLGGADKTVAGGTTIAGTMVLAHLAGIRVFATGGLGGVHRGGESSMDVSADLTELGRTPVAVICSGCKGFLDIPRTLEYLETQGVGVATFADGGEDKVDFPAFWSRDSGTPSPEVLRSSADAANVIHAHSRLGLSSGLLLANPIPREFAIPRSEITSIIETAIAQADAAGVHGSANTPFVLDAIRNLTQGKSITSNEALIESNVRRGSQVAVALAQLEDPSSIAKSTYQPKLPVDPPTPTPAHSASASEPTDVFVAGSIAIDVSCDYLPPTAATTQPQPHTSNPSRITQTVGGVGFNVARAAHLAGARTHFHSILADDLAGQTALRAVAASGLSTAGIAVVPASPTAQTPTYVAVNDAGHDLALAMADMRLLEQPQPSSPPRLPLPPPSWAVVDANWAPVQLHAFLSTARQAGVATAFEPVSAAKAGRLFSAAPDTLPLRVADVAAPNRLELAALHSAARAAGLFERQDWWAAVDALGIPGGGASGALVSAAGGRALVDEGVPQRAIQLLPFVPSVAVKLGAGGVLVVRVLRVGAADEAALRSGHVVAHSKTGEGGVAGLYVRLFPPAEVLRGEDVVSVNGAGDTFLGALVARLARLGSARVEDAVEFAQRASALTLRSGESVSPDITDRI